MNTDISIDYRTLPAGRNRQLAYSYHIRTMLPIGSSLPFTDTQVQYNKF